MNHLKLLCLRPNLSPKLCMGGKILLKNLPPISICSLWCQVESSFSVALDQALNPTAKKLQFDCSYQKDNSISLTLFYSAGITDTYQLLCTTPQAQSSYKPGEVGFMAAVRWQDNTEHTGRCDLVFTVIQQ